jgi:hypothetical protein
MLGCPSLVPFTTGRAFGDGGIERPRAGLRGPRPGTGARRTGTGEAMLGWGLDVPFAEKPGSIYSYVFARALLVAQPARLSMQQVLLQKERLLCEGHSGRLVSQVYWDPETSQIPQERGGV